MEQIIAVVNQSAFGDLEASLEHLGVSHSEDVIAMGSGVGPTGMRAWAGSKQLRSSIVKHQADPAQPSEKVDWRLKNAAHHV